MIAPNAAFLTAERLFPALAPGSLTAQILVYGDVVSIFINFNVHMLCSFSAILATIVFVVEQQSELIDDRPAIFAGVNQAVTVNGPPRIVVANSIVHRHFLARDGLDTGDISNKLQLFQRKPVKHFVAVSVRLIDVFAVATPIEEMLRLKNGLSQFVAISSFFIRNIIRASSSCIIDAEDVFHQLTVCFINGTLCVAVDGRMDEFFVALLLVLAVLGVTLCAREVLLTRFAGMRFLAGLCVALCVNTLQSLGNHVVQGNNRVHHNFFSPF